MIARLFLALMLNLGPAPAFNIVMFDAGAGPNSNINSNIAEPIRVLVFTTTDCPISNRYAPEIQRLGTKFSGRAKFILVYPVASDSPQLIREHQKQYGYSFESVRDTTQQLVKQTGVTVTPEVAVMIGETMVYRGRIDDRYIAFGKDRPNPTERDLESTLDALMAGKRVTPRTTQAIGCYLADLLK